VTAWGATSLSEASQGSGVLEEREKENSRRLEVRKRQSP